MKKQFFQYCMLICMSTIAACGSGDVDVTSRTLEVNTYSPEPTVDEVCGTQEPVVFNLTGGDQLTFDVIFKDNESLSQYKVDIHDNFDCHGHGGGSAPQISIPSVPSQTTDWTLLETVDITGTDAPITRTLDVPSNVTTGNYHFQIQVADESGNDHNAGVFFSLKIKNPLDDILPEITVDEPANNTFSIAKGEKIRFVGQVTDERSLSDGGNGVLFLSYTDLSSGNTFSTDEVFLFNETVDKTFDFDFEYTVPQTLIDGRNYRFSLGAYDGVRNVAPFQFFEVVVTN